MVTPVVVRLCVEICWNGPPNTMDSLHRFVCPALAGGPAQEGGAGVISEDTDV